MAMSKCTSDVDRRNMTYLGEILLGASEIIPPCPCPRAGIVLSVMWRLQIFAGVKLVFNVNVDRQFKS